MRRELWETLLEILNALSLPEAAVQGLRIQSATLDLPVEVAMSYTENGFKLFVDLPRWRWIGGIQEQPARMRLTIHTETSTETQ